MKRVVVILIFVVVLSATFSVVSAQPKKRFCLEIEELCNVDDLLPAAVEVKGSSQGMAIAGRYAFLMHDKGGCVVLDIKRLKYISYFVLDGNTGHCNNASFGCERLSSKSQFPLLYVTECRGRRACYVNDVTLSGSRLVQTIYYDGDDIVGPADWFVDAKSRRLWLYCTRDGERMLKEFRLPLLADSDSAGEVHLSQEDVLSEQRLGAIAIPQGSMKHRRRVYLPDGVPSRERWLHVVDVVSGEKVGQFDINHIPYEPEGVARRGGKLYISFHTPRNPRQNRIYTFRLKRQR